MLTRVSLWILAAALFKVLDLLRERKRETESPIAGKHGSNKQEQEAEKLGLYHQHEAERELGIR